MNLIVGVLMGMSLALFLMGFCGGIIGAINKH